MKTFEDWIVQDMLTHTNVGSPRLKRFFVPVPIEVIIMYGYIVSLLLCSILVDISSNVHIWVHTNTNVTLSCKVFHSLLQGSLKWNCNWRL